MALKCFGMVCMRDHTHATIPPGPANSPRQRVDGRDDALGCVIVSNRRLVEIDSDEGGRFRINRLEGAEPAAPGNDLLDDLLWNAARVLHI
jgi:hypothetical protein